MRKSFPYLYHCITECKLVHRFYYMNFTCSFLLCTIGSRCGNYNRTIVNTIYHTARINRKNRFILRFPLKMLVSCSSRSNLKVKRLKLSLRNIHLIFRKLNLCNIFVNSNRTACNKPSVNSLTDNYRSTASYTRNNTVLVHNSNVCIT